MVSLCTSILDWDVQMLPVILSVHVGNCAAALFGINELGGITIAKILETAIHPYQLVIAIASGCLDYVLSPENIGDQIAWIASSIKN